MRKPFKNFCFTIPFAPVTKKNSQQIITKATTTYDVINGKVVPIEKYKPIPLPSKPFLTYQENSGWYIPHRGDMIDIPLQIKYLFYVKKEQVDLTNLEEAMDDILVHYHVIKDDNISIVASHDGSRAFVDKENPRTEVYISAYRETDRCEVCASPVVPCSSCSFLSSCTTPCEKVWIQQRIKEGKGYCPNCGRKL